MNKPSFKVVAPLALFWFVVTLATTSVLSRPAANQSQVATPALSLPAISDALTADQQAALDQYPLDATSNRHYVPGELLVGFGSGLAATRIATILEQNNLREKTRDHLSDLLDKIDVKVVSIPDLPDQANPRAAIARLEGNPNVKFAELNYVLVPASVTPNDYWYFGQWHLPKISAPAAWDTTTGSSNVTIAVLDTGVYGAHPDLASRLVPGWNVNNNSSDTSDPSGHGTGVVGTVAAATNNSIGVAGVNWGGPLMPIRVSDSIGAGTTSGIIANGIIWAADHGARVANVSYAVYGSSTFSNAAQYMQSKGGVVVASAGNDAVYSNAPDDPYVLTIGATDINDALASFSNRGNFVDLVAPGVGIYTTTKFADVPYGSGTGTSFASPIVAGVAALVISANPSLTAIDVQDIIKQSADDLGTAGWDPYYSWGRVNAARAVAAACARLGNTCGTIADIIPPTASITSPASGSTVIGSVAISANASDNVAVIRVDFYKDADTAAFASDLSSPYGATLDTTVLNNGTHTLSAKAYDASGNFGTSASVSINVNNPITDITPPTVSITSPSNGGTVSGTITIQVSASDNVGVTSVGAVADSVSLGSDTSSPYSFTWNTSSVSNGSHTITVTAEDAAGNNTSVSINVNVSNTTTDTTAPNVVITGPAPNSSVSGTVTVSVNATDPTVVGQTTSGVASVGLTADGVSLGTDTSSPYSFTWNTATVSNGNHNLTARATDVAGNNSSQTITVNVNNPVALQITSASVSRVTGTSAKISWQTNLPATGVVNYGTASNNLNLFQSVNTALTSQAVTLTGLSANQTTYYYRIVATPPSGTTAQVSGSFKTKRR